MSSAEERETIHRALTGDQNAFRKLYRTHRDRIKATVAQRTKDPDDVEDLVQVSFIRAFSGLGKFRGESAFSTWLTRIALNVCITHHQNRRVMLPESILEIETESLPPTPNQEDLLDRKERWNTVVTGIENLPPRYRNVMRMHYVEDRPYPELVERLNIPIGTLKTWLFRGRQMIKLSVESRNA
jgi:RNA polymerase sigma-70 factor, ECF subfamily